MALYGRSLRVRAGRIETPGGSPATSLWEALTGERVTRPDRFILEVLGKDGGRLALSRTRVAHLDGPRQAFALGLWIRDPGQRMDAFRALYSACVTSLGSWDPVARPFSRGLYDAAQLLMFTPVMPDGRPGPISWRKLWEKAFDSDELADRPESELKNVERDGVVDAAWMVARLAPEHQAPKRAVGDVAVRAARLRRRDGCAIPQLLVVLRGYDTFRALGDTLERAGISQPDVYVTAFRQAQRVTSSAIVTGRRPRSGCSRVPWSSSNARA